MRSRVCALAGTASSRKARTASFFMGLTGSAIEVRGNRTKVLEAYQPLHRLFVGSKRLHVEAAVFGAQREEAAAVEFLQGAEDRRLVGEGAAELGQPLGQAPQLGRGQRARHRARVDEDFM